MRLPCALTLLLLVGSVGCAARKGIQLATPDSVNAIAAWREAVNKSILELKIGAPTDEKGKRDVAIAYSTALVMAQYGTVRTSLMKGRAIGSIVFDVLDLGLTSSVPITNGARGKTILGSLATGLKGTQLSIDRNLFNQQTTGAILTAMDTCVLRQRRLIDTKRALPVADYSMYDAYSDLVYLYGCTTLAGALEELVETQSAAARQEKTTLITITEQERDKFQAAQKAYIASVDGDKTIALAFLKEMGVQNLTSASAKQDFLDAYQKLGFLALTNADQKAKFLAAALKAGLIN
jgi:hypothetical protein